ncbi:hypothetical protein ID866_11718 [Astraeus odoratus]|nr:hypothetical protein ID866_11718 [Astraeus odoratus]
MLAIEQFRLHASRYQHQINLNKRISKDESDVLHGGCAAVWSGTLSSEGDNRRKVAIKIPRIDPPGDETTVARALDEVRRRCELDHENVLPLLGITTDFDLAVSIISPWVGRGNAHDYVQDTGVDPCLLIQNVANGLAYLHTLESGPICHGNLKGPNVLISDEGEAVISDFHVASFGGPSFGASNPGEFRGTINWMAPEITEGGGPSAAADTWAFGMTALVYPTFRPLPLI